MMTPYSPIPDPPPTPTSSSQLPPPLPPSLFHLLRFPRQRNRTSGRNLRLRGSHIGLKYSRGDSRLAPLAAEECACTGGIGADDVRDTQGVDSCFKRSAKRDRKMKKSV